MFDKLSQLILDGTISKYSVDNSNVSLRGNLLLKLTLYMKDGSVKVKDFWSTEDINEFLEEEI